MIGRESELAALDAAAAAVRAGGCGCVLVTGEAGVGKTRLVAEALARSALVAYGGASPATGSIAHAAAPSSTLGPAPALLPGGRQAGAP